jgi:hypothetical protein
LLDQFGIESYGVISHAPGLLSPQDWTPGISGLEFDYGEVDSLRFSHILTLMREHGTMLDPTVAIFDRKLAANDTETNSRKRWAI